MFIFANRHRKHFPPATEVPSDEDREEGGVKLDESKTEAKDEAMSQLPDAPTNQPVAEGQPEAKKLKSSHSDTGDFDKVTRSEL